MIITLQTRASSYCRSLIALFFESRTSYKLLRRNNIKLFFKADKIFTSLDFYTSSFLVTMVRAEGSKLEADNTSLSCAS